MSDYFNKLIDDHTPNILNDQFSQLCYEVFLENDKGKILMAHLYDQYVNKPFLKILDNDPNPDTNEIMIKTAWKDLVQRLLLNAQTYQSALNDKLKGGNL